MKKAVSIFLAIILTAISLMFFAPPVEAEAATTYDFLFPVNNGGVIIYNYFGKASHTDDHKGLDIFSDTDQLVYASFSGTVTKVFNSCNHVHQYNRDCGHWNSWGNCIYVKSEDGKIYGIYGHLKQNSILVKVGDKVERGQPLASMGSSGCSTDKHLHFEVRTDTSSSKYAINVNPTNASNPGLVVYSAIGYNKPMSDTIYEGTYTFNNDGYRMYMKKDASDYGTLGVSNSTVTSKFKFTIIKDGNFYRVVPQDGGANYLNSVWNDSKSTHSLDGAEVTLCKNDKSDYSQKWLFEKSGDGYLIHPACTPAFSITRENEKLVVKKTTGAANQIWKLEGDCNHQYETKYEGTEDPFTASAQHWQECTNCGDKKDYEPHSWSLFPYTMEEGHIYRCNDCDEVMYEVHTYSNACDSYCNTCDYERSVLHSYTNACDKDCNVCGATRSTTHVYTNNCDSSCNVCGAKRTAAHKYTNNCDTSCDTCGATRVASHTYSNNCDASCNTCGATRAASHTYTNNCDTSCDTCGATRTASHTFSNSCDTSCNTCGAKRTVSHAYTNNCDADCNNCGFKRTASHTYTNSCDAICNVCAEVRTAAHKYTNECDEDCDICKEKRTTAHIYGEPDIIVPPTCQSKGTQKSDCLLCGVTKTEEIDKTEHVLEERIEGDSIQYSCKNCDYSFTEPNPEPDDDNDDDKQNKDDDDDNVLKIALIIGGSIIIGLSAMGLTIGLIIKKKQSKPDNTNDA